MDDLEHPLAGGNVTEGVVRVGETVRRPATAATPAIEAYLEHLHRAGFSSAPRTLGRDEQGRQVLEYIPGKSFHTLPPMTHLDLTQLGKLIRQLHDASESFVPPANAHWNVAIGPNREDLICHNDLAPWNLIRGDDNRWIFIDWDGAGPGSRLWDLAYAAAAFLPLEPRGLPTRDNSRLRALADGYQLTREQREQLPQLLVDRTRSMYNLLLEGHHTNRQPWARLYAEGHASHWGPATDYIERNLEVWKKSLL